jgi:hypothetical protein
MRARGELMRRNQQSRVRAAVMERRLWDGITIFVLASTFLYLLTTLR